MIVNKETVSVNIFLMYIMDDNEITNANNIEKLQEEQRKQAQRHRNAAQNLITERPSSYAGLGVSEAVRRGDHTVAENFDLEELHNLAAEALETAANAAPDMHEHFSFLARFADQQAIARGGRGFTPEAGSAKRKKTKNRRKRTRKTKHRKSRRKHKKTKRKRRR